MRRPPHIALALALIAGAIACAHPGQMSSKGQVPPAVAAHAPAPAAAAAAAVAPAPSPQPAAPPRPAAPPSDRIYFASQVEPILAARCRPCHFPGGAMYERLPFDRAATVLELREKLFTRIKKETDRQTIRKFLAQQPGAATGGSY
jgi:hypothetical protein